MLRGEGVLAMPRRPLLLPGATVRLPDMGPADVLGKAGKSYRLLRLILWGMGHMGNAG